MENIESNHKTVSGEIFEQFTSDDKMRVTLQEIFKNGDYIFATDAVSLIYVHKDSYTGHYVENNDCYPYSKFIVEPNSNILIPITDLNPFKTEVEYDAVDNRVECKTCDGTGEVEWEFEGYTKDDNCPECLGDGVIGEFKEVPTGEMTFGLMVYVRIKGVLFHASQIHRLFETAKKLESDVYLTHVPDKLDAFTFQIGVVNVVVMPCFSTDADEEMLNIE